MLVEVDVDMAVLLLTGPVGPSVTLRILDGRYEEALLHRKRDCGREGKVGEARVTDKAVADTSRIRPPVRYGVRLVYKRSTLSVEVEQEQ